MKLWKVSKIDGSKKEISYGEALDLLEGNYDNPEEVLANAGIVPLMYFYIEITD